MRETNPSLAAPVELPEVFGRYRIMRRLGQGGMGAVYLARDTELHREVALKVPHFAAENKEIIERFYREARAAAGLSHPNICPIYDVGQCSGTFYLTMGYVEGKPLTEFIRPGKPLGQTQAAALVRKLALALDEAHRKGIIHRDLKPANIMINLRKEPVIMDFGLARRTDSDDARITKSGTVVGTPAYMSPEQVGGKDVGPASDIFSLGVILYEMLTARLPFEGSALAVLGQILTQEPEAPTKHRPDLHADLDAVCRKAMAKDAKDRFASMAEFAAALAQFLRGGASAATVSPIETQATPIQEAKNVVTPRPAAGLTIKAPAWEEIAAEDKATARPKNRATVKAKSIWQKPWPWLGIAGAALAVLAIVLLSGVIFRVQTKNGVVVLDINEPGAQVFVDDELKITVVSPSDKEPIKIEVPEGKHVLKVVKGGFMTETKEFTLRAGTPQEIRVTLRPETVVAGKKVDQPPLTEPIKEPIKDPVKEKAQDEPVATDKSWTPWFTTADLADWDGFRQNWRVENNQLIGSSEPSGVKKNICLVSKKRYKDFELKFQVMLTGAKANSGVQVRSEYADPSNFVLKGPQADMGDMYWGSLYGEMFGGMMQAGPKDIQERIKQDGFNDYYIKCVGNTVLIQVNGETTVAGAFPTMPVDGYLGWQIHSGGPMTVTVRNVQFRELTPAVASPPSGDNTPPPGFTALFNGKDLTGWKTHPDAPGNWKVENGNLVGRGPGVSHLYTERNDYADFHFFVECRINAKGNSGQDFRVQEMKPGIPSGYEAQIDSGSHPNKTGTLYILAGKGTPLDGAFVKNVLVPPDTWHTQEVIAKGNHIVIKVNDKVVTDFVDKNSTYRQGFLALQVFDPPTVVEFRQVLVKEIKPAAVEPAADFVSLFNGKDLAGWQGDQKFWSVADGAIVGSGTIRNYLSTTKTFRDFILKARFKPIEGDSSIAFRGKPNALHAVHVFTGNVRFGNLMDETPLERGGKPISITDWKDPKQQALTTLQKNNDWNDIVITAVGEHLRCEINGTIVFDQKHPGGPKEGVISLKVLPNTRVAFKDFLITEIMDGKLPATDPKTGRAANKEVKPPPAVEPPADFVSLFNGKDLTGWIGQGGKPAAWKVGNGYLEVPPPGQGHIWTKENFGDFQLHAEFWVPLQPERKDQGRGNSGIFLQGRYEIQVLDSFNNPTKPEQACGALYGQIGPSQNVCKPPEQWQSFDITFRAPRVDSKGSVMEKGRLTVIHNDVTVIDNREFDKVSAGARDANQGTPGPILLQDHGNPVRFRNLWIRPLAPAASVPVKPAPPPKLKAAFVPLFNGKDLTGWRPHPADKAVWVVNNGVLVGSGPRGHLFSARNDYENFHFRVEARINAAGNSGQYFRAQFESPFPKGYEAQISTAQADQRTGSLYNFVKIPQQLHRAGDWFTQEVIAQDNHIVILVNNKKVVDFRDPLNTYTKGHLALQQNTPTTIVEFRKIEVKELPP